MINNLEIDERPFLLKMKIQLLIRVHYLRRQTSAFLLIDWMNYELVIEQTAPPLILAHLCNPLFNFDMFADNSYKCWISHYQRKTTSYLEQHQLRQVSPIQMTAVPALFRMFVNISGRGR
jgi:hypothetical protein